MAPNYGLFYGIEITTLCVALICFTLRLSNRYLKKISTFVSTRSYPNTNVVFLYTRHFYIAH